LLPACLSCCLPRLDGSAIAFVVTQGGNSDFYRATNLTDEEADQLVLTTGLVTERSARLKGTIDMPEPELVNTGGVTKADKEKAKEEQECDRMAGVFL
jgi:hypothetical protein